MEKSPDKISWAKYSKETIKDLKLYCVSSGWGCPSSCCQINIIKASNHDWNLHNSIKRAYTQQPQVQQINFSLFVTIIYNLH